MKDQVNKLQDVSNDAYLVTNRLKALMRTLKASKVFEKAQDQEVEDVFQLIGLAADICEEAAEEVNELDNEISTFGVAVANAGPTIPLSGKHLFSLVKLLVEQKDGDEWAEEMAGIMTLLTKPALDDGSLIVVLGYLQKVMYDRGYRGKIFPNPQDWRYVEIPVFDDAAALVKAKEAMAQSA